MTRGFVEIFAHPLLTPDLAAQAEAAMDQIQARRPATPAGPRSTSEGAPR
jgi:hypothetical protein